MLSKSLVKGPMKLEIFLSGHWFDNLKENMGVLFVLIFQGLTFLCAGLLIQGSLALADGVALGAYFILNITLVLQITYFIQHRKAEDRGKDD